MQPGTIANSNLYSFIRIGSVSPLSSMQDAMLGFCLIYAIAGGLFMENCIAKWIDENGGSYTFWGKYAYMPIVFGAMSIAMIYHDVRLV